MITPAEDSSSIMSSFLMNSGSYGADPKFLSAEDYHSQASAASAVASSGYMSHGDYYAQHAAAAHYPGAGYPTTSMGLNSQQATAAGLVPAGYGRGAEHMYGGYYQQCSVNMQQHMQLQQQMMQAASGGHLSPLNQGSHLSSGTGARSPVASPQPHLSNNVLNHGGSGHDGNGNSLCASGGNGGNGGGSNGGDEGYPSPQHPGIQQPQLTPGGGGNDGMSSDCSDDESSPQSNRQMPVVYPWMKKIHVGGVGKLIFWHILMDPFFDWAVLFHQIMTTNKVAPPVIIQWLRGGRIFSPLRPIRLL